MGGSPRRGPGIPKRQSFDPPLGPPLRRGSHDRPTVSPGGAPFTANDRGPKSWPPPARPSGSRPVTMPSWAPAGRYKGPCGRSGELNGKAAVDRGGRRQVARCGGGGREWAALVASRCARARRRVGRTANARLVRACQLHLLKPRPRRPLNTKPTLPERDDTPPLTHPGLFAQRLRKAAARGRERPPGFDVDRRPGTRALCASTCYNQSARTSSEKGC